MLGNIQEAKARGGSVIALTTKGDAASTRCSIRGRLESAPAGGRRFAPVVMTVIPLQLLAYHIAVRAAATSTSC
jgi:glutamine---fructose-6-phosphate transaminase (isomerizing)